MADYNDFLNQIMRKESSGVATAQNPRSTAGGLFQFINSTWGNVLRRMDPQAYGEMSNKELASLKSDPALSWKAAQYHIATDIAPKLQAENIEMTPGRAYLAWFQGPQGAVDAIQSNPESKVSDVFPKTIKANANMQFNGKPYADWSMTDLQSWADRKMAGVGGQAAAAPAGYTAPWSNAASTIGNIDQKYLNGGLGFIASPITGLLGMFGQAPSMPQTAPTPAGGGGRQPDILAPVAGGDARLQPATSMTPEALKTISGLAGLGSSLMAAGQGQPSWQPGAAAPVTRGQWRDDIFAGLLGPRSWG
jgi:hypothetical protein